MNAATNSPPVPTVFLSYRHEDDAHRARVRDLAVRLEGKGVIVILDQFAQERTFRGGGPNEGWPRWSKAQAGDASHKVLIIASTGWFKCYEGKVLAGNGLGAAAEAGVIEQRLYNSAGVSPDVRIVTFTKWDPTVLPLDLQRYHRFPDPKEFDDLAHWLTGVAATVPIRAAVADWPDTPPPLLWPMADHGDVRRALEQLLTRGTPHRFLPLRGPSEAGKTHITKQILGNALRLPGLACGRFDFKGTTDVDAELRAFVQHLDVPAPAPATRLNERLGHFLDALNRRARPALLVFDTYEAAGEAQDWIEKQLLPNLIRAAWLRVVIAGQRVPERAGALWENESLPPLQLTPPPPEDWFAYGQPHKPGITLDFVRQAHACCGGKASLLAQLLGPIA
jgi:hypothetical protein